MSEITTLEIKTENLKKLLLDYYKKFYNDESVDIVFKSNKVYEGFYEFQKLVTKIFVKRNKLIDLKIGKAFTTIEEEVTVDDIKKVLDKAIEDSEYQVSDVNLQTTEESYGIYEDTRICFKGINSKLHKKEKQKTLRR